MMKIAKCEGCLKQYDELFGGCPHYESLIDEFQRMGNTIYAMQGKYASSVIELRDAVSQEFLNYDFSCIFYSSKPTTEEAFL